VTDQDTGGLYHKNSLRFFGVDCGESLTDLIGGAASLEDCRIDHCRYSDIVLGSKFFKFFDSSEIIFEIIP